MICYFFDNISDSAGLQTSSVVYCVLPKAKEEPRQVQTSNVDENFEPYAPKIHKSGTGCVYQINDSLWEGSFYPRLTDGKRKKFNVYAKTREECEDALAKMIAEKKAEIAAEKAKMKTA